MSRPKGRECDGPPVSVRLPAHLHDVLCRMAIQQETSVGSVIRDGLTHFVVTKRVQAHTSAQ